MFLRKLMLSLMFSIALVPALAKADYVCENVLDPYTGLVEYRCFYDHTPGDSTPNVPDTCEYVWNPQTGGYDYLCH